MDSTCFSLATTTMAPAEKLLLPPAAAVPPPSSAPPCRKLPFFRFVPAAPPPSFPPPSPAPPPPEPSGTVTVEDEEPRPPAETKIAGPGEGGDSAAASAEVEDRMDQLWEDFNEELTGQVARARRRARPRGGSWRGDGQQLAMEGGRSARAWSEPSPSPPSSDAESEPAAARAGCAPVLRPSARAAGGARHCRRRAGTWVLLMRIFRRLFVIEKTISSAAAVARQSSSTRAR